ncbi:hypothetical protein FSARC_8670 [Fusarium sarcochroum]|uniref:Apple domain-containing protein n=1 Tax=Fusarium sarcochroum TaxID=1208366 RepID=A0A8H4X625_9HYPO|nr:hypothetical protein FSARC_8670 [Fusarium sarcochroum]
MKTTMFYAALLPLLVASGLAADGNGGSSLICRTEMGTTSVSSVETDTTTETMKAGPTTTVTLNLTVTDQVSRWFTITKLATKTFTVTDKGTADTSNTTTTLFKVGTVTVTATATATITKTDTSTSTSTTQVPTSSGFEPISDTVNSETLPLNRRFASKRGKAAQNPHAPPKINAGLKAFDFPSQVDCTKLLPNTTTQTVWKTGNPFTTTISTLKSTTTTKTISTTTTLIPNDVSVTKTFSLTLSVSISSTTWKTVTSSATTTKTKVLSGPTIYAACSQDNMLGPNFNSSGDVGYYVSNVANDGPGSSSDFQAVVTGAGSAVACCDACQQFDSCETWTYRARNSTCSLIYHAGDTCQSQTSNPNYFTSKKGSDAGAGYVVGNGNCGYTYSGNSDGSVFSVELGVGISVEKL